jgi:hypothetical protein
MKEIRPNEDKVSWVSNKVLIGSLLVKGTKIVFFAAQNIRFFFLLMFSMSTLSGIGQQSSNDVSMNFDRYKTSDVFLLTVSNKNSNDIIVRISNDKKEILFEQSMRFVEKIKKVYNLSTLPMGTYQFSVSNNAGSSRSVTIETTESFMEHPENGKSILVGFSKISLKKSINLIVQNKTNKTVAMTIQNGIGKIIQQQDMGKDELIKKEVSLDQIPSGNYIIKVGNKDNQFQTYVTI